MAKKRGLKVAGGRTNHRTGVLFPYLDNDCFSYPELDTYLECAKRQLDAKVRVATVGFSRHNQHLVAMHERIVAQQADAFAGIRLSYTPYTAGFAATTGLKLSRDEFEADAAHFLRLYRPVFEQLGFGKDTACVELRFHPDVRRTKVIETQVAGHHLISAGPHVLLSTQTIDGSTIPETQIRSVVDGVPEYSTPPVPYWLITNEDLVTQEGPVGVADLILGGDTAVTRQMGEVPVYRFSNVDGAYYAVSPDFRTDGRFVALHIYPQTSRRQASGYNNASRYFLNALLRIKAQLGYARRDRFESATWGDVHVVLEKLDEQVERLEANDAHAALHVQRHIIPLVTSYVRVLKGSGYPPSRFFDPGFTVDTGQIVNQGRARRYFADLVSTEDEPMTPREARAYGDEQSVSAQRGRVWRIVPVPVLPDRAVKISQAGGKAVFDEAGTSGVAIHEVSEHTLRPVDSKTGEPLRKFIIPGLSVVMRRRHESRDEYQLPGAVRKEET